MFAKFLVLQKIHDFCHNTPCTMSLIVIGGQKMVNSSRKDKHPITIYHVEELWQKL